ncbi:hypothetical protein CKAN_01967400 [Cinnamomum micranthum f. kanehirae]|uniref:Uncharacterized protein n=1 Tax=Cinnamomum micranthum f. kanehirae TaxID=337451 RepID=A0A443PIH9_9MAGN|nr:hypothetical protein CKAN_01967400 [Cinnamomum micranthum f. kanehirae]
MDSPSKAFSFPPFLSLRIQNSTSKSLLHSLVGIRSVRAREKKFLLMNASCSTNCLSGHKLGFQLY